MEYEKISTEQLFRECFNQVLRVVENYRGVPDGAIFNDFKDYIGAFYPK